MVNKHEIALNKDDNDLNFDYSDRNNHVEGIPVAAKDQLLKNTLWKDHLFFMYGLWIDDNEYLESLENSTKLNACTE